MTAEQTTPEDLADHCDGPETCVDDLCRYSERGLCGRWRDDRAHDHDDFDDDDWTDN